ncbi:MAG: ABC transporter ATP-binding protein [Candidatus Coatesbacteria bacterium]|nr:ABC transporter ATP-binding protein [Candidatus Coatesbacteria bacterium]
MNDDYFPEDALDRPYDWRLMKRLLAFSKPYWPIITLCAVLVIISAGFDVSLPYLTRIAIDRYVAVASKMVTLENESLREHFQTQYGDLITPVSKTEFLIDATETQKLFSEDLKLLRDDGLISDERIYVVLSQNYSAEDWDAAAEVCRKNSFTEFDGGFYIAAEDLTKMPLADLLTLRKRDLIGLKTLAMIYLAILVLNFLISYGHVYLMQWASQRTLYDLRVSLFDHMQRLPLSFFDKSPVGRLVTRTTNDFSNLQEMFGAIIITIIKDVLMVLSIAGIMLYMSVKFALISFVVLPFVVYVSIIFRRKARGAFRKIRVKIAKMNALFAEFISGMGVIRAFCQEGRINKKFQDINHEVFAWRQRQITILAIFRPTVWILNSLGTGIIIWYGGGKVIQNEVTLGIFVAFIAYMRMFFMPIHDLTEKFNTIQAAMASSERIFQLIDREPEPVVQDLPEKGTPEDARVEFRDVWFAYKGDNWVLKDVSFAVKPGETVAIVGATGAGKTTMTSLLSRLYPIQKGKILIDDTDIARLSLSNLRKMIGVVQQDVFLFSTTIGHNVTLNDESIDEAAVKDAIKIARAEKLVSRLPKGLDEPVVERGATLSSGEKQLIAFARVLAYNPKILVLDEATSNIDPETESLIQEALINLTRGRTCLIVAHRLSTIEHADRILVLHKGRLREVGTHYELLEKRGIYYDLYRLQYAERNRA